jgi:mannose-1-phosphate guanylyltransferase
MEKAESTVMLETNFEWHDIGSWNSIEEIYTRNKDGCVVMGNHCSIDTKNSIILSDNVLVGTVGIKDLVIIQSKDAILVCDKNKTQDVKKLVDKLIKEGYESYT